MSTAKGQSAPAVRGPQTGATHEPLEFDELWRPDEQNALRGPERVLVDSGLISQDQLELARQRQKEQPRLTILDALVQTKAIDETLAMQAVATYFKLPFRRLAPGEVNEKAFEKLPAEYIKSKLVIPITYEEEVLVVGISDPADIFLIDDVKRRLKRSFQLVVVPPADILQVVESLHKETEQPKVDEIIGNINEDDVEVEEKTAEEVADLEKSAGESPVIRYVNFLIAQAVREGASDIHIEPKENRVRVRLRVDGVLFDQPSPPGHMHSAIISRLKIMSSLDIAERRLPQDGRIRATVHGRSVDLRVSTLPVNYGEKCVIRILDNRSIMVGLENLGMMPDILEHFKAQILRPHGIVLVTGPTGSGKSTTLYSSLQIMDGDRLNISTVEDPVEYELDFVNQVNIHGSIGMTFGAALRSLLRQDPDVIMLGEIRDEETARIAIQASLTGHLVLSTLHTNDAPSSVTRLINVGLEPFLISAAMNCVIAQRLVRRICENCKQKLEEVPEVVQAYLTNYGDCPKEIYQGTGCDRCRRTGYKGRVGLYELMIVDDELRDLISRNPTAGDLRAAARRAGMRTLREDGLLKVAEGRTTVEELMRITEV